eukprot:1214509-Amphidinium_carterae.1
MVHSLRVSLLKQAHRASWLVDSNTAHFASGRHVVDDLSSGGRPVCTRCLSSGPMKFARAWLSQNCSSVLFACDLNEINSSLKSQAARCVAIAALLDSLRRKAR